jgi:phosphatidylserine synthase
MRQMPEVNVYFFKIPPNSMKNFLTLKKLFLFDGIAGILSAAAAMSIKIFFAALVNLPESLLTALIIIGSCYAAFSLTVSFLVPKRTDGRFLLKVLVVANSMYVLFCLVQVGVFYQTATIVGVAYLTLDAVAVALVAAFEWWQYKAGLR